MLGRLFDIVAFRAHIYPFGSLYIWGLRPWGRSLPTDIPKIWPALGGSNHLCGCRVPVPNLETIVLSEVHWQNKELGQDLRCFWPPHCWSYVQNFLGSLRTDLPKLRNLPEGTSWAAWCVPVLSRIHPWRWRNMVQTECSNGASVARCLR